MNLRHEHAKHFKYRLWLWHPFRVLGGPVPGEMIMDLYLRSLAPAPRAAPSAWAKSGDVFRRLRMACRAIPTAAADSWIVHPSVSFRRRRRPRQSKFMGGDYPKHVWPSTCAAKHGESDSRRCYVLLRFVPPFCLLLARSYPACRTALQLSKSLKPLKTRGIPHFQVVRVRRIELLPQAWEAHVLPLNYTRKIQGR